MQKDDLSCPCCPLSLAARTTVTEGVPVWQVRDTRVLLKKLGTGVRDADKVELPCPPFLEHKVIKVG